MPPEEIEQWPLGRLLSTAARLVEHEWNAGLADRGLTHSGLLALHALGDGPRTQRELAAASHVEEQTMSRVLDRLQRTGYVTRDRDPDDRRRLLVQRTPAGTRAWRSSLRGNRAESLVGDRLPDPERFRADLVHLVRGLLAS